MTVWCTIAPPGTCPWGCGLPTTHVVQWPPGAVESGDPDGPLFDQARTYACAADAAKIVQYQNRNGDHVVVREVGEGNW